MELVGIVRCPTTSLTPFGEGRQIDHKIVDRLARRYGKTKCDANDAKHHVRGIVTHNDLDAILSSLNLSLQGLQDTIEQTSFPLLPDHRIAHIDGRHRIAAAVVSGQIEWTVKLYLVRASWTSFPTTLAFETAGDAVLIQDEVESSSCESAYSDGEVYRLIRKYMAQDDTNRVDELRSRLTRCKEISLNGLLRRTELVSALDHLLQFPGMLGGLQLGNVHKHLALHADEHIKRYLEHIRAVWTRITDDDPFIKQSVDLESIQCLQLRAPYASAFDRRVIDQMFKKSIIFSGITNNDVRERLKERVLSLDVVIPSLEAFHENMKFMSIGVRILREHVLVSSRRMKRKNRPSLFESLAADWQNPVEAQVEVADGRFDKMLATPNVYVAYVQLFLAALRNFPRLSLMSPRQDLRGEVMSASVDQSQVQKLLKLASTLGFDNSNIRAAIENPTDHSNKLDFEPGQGQFADWRCGRPFTKTYIALKSQAFVGKLELPRVRTDVPDPAFIFRDMISAFFVAYQIEGLQTQCPQQPVVPEALDTIMEEDAFVEVLKPKAKQPALRVQKHKTRKSTVGIPRDVRRHGMVPLSTHGTRRKLNSRTGTPQIQRALQSAESAATSDHDSTFIGSATFNFDLGTEMPLFVNQAGYTMPDRDETRSLLGSADNFLPDIREEQFTDMERSSAVEQPTSEGQDGAGTSAGNVEAHENHAELSGPTPSSQVMTQPDRDGRRDRLGLEETRADGATNSQSRPVPPIRGLKRQRSSGTEGRPQHLTVQERRARGPKRKVKQVLTLDGREEVIWEQGEGPQISWRRRSEARTPPRPPADGEGRGDGETGETGSIS
ncbi:hypothetical protein JX266_012092 [Neoarthrinium moseri]|nr:hypothetical protein JX266_012092 [Neoarthrinium moseri]